MSTKAERDAAKAAEDAALEAAKAAADQGPAPQVDGSTGATSEAVIDEEAIAEAERLAEAERTRLQEELEAQEQLTADLRARALALSGDPGAANAAAEAIGSEEPKPFGYSTPGLLTNKITGKRA